MFKSTIIIIDNETNIDINGIYSDIMAVSMSYIQYYDTETCNNNLKNDNVTYFEQNRQNLLFNSNQNSETNNSNNNENENYLNKCNNPLFVNITHNNKTIFNFTQNDITGVNQTAILPKCLIYDTLRTRKQLSFFCLFLVVFLYVFCAACRCNAKLCLF